MKDDMVYEVAMTCTKEKLAVMYSIATKRLLELKKENAELKDLLYRLQSFFGVDRELLYRDLDGKLYPLDISEINKILEKE